MALKWYYQEKQERWRLRYNQDGIDKSFYSTLKNEKKARMQCEKAYTKWLTNEKVSPEDITVEKAWSEFLDYYELRVKTTSYNTMLATGKAHIKKLFKKKLQAVTKGDWQHLLDEAYKQGAKSSPTLKRISSAIVNFNKFCAAKGYIKDEAVPLFFLKPANLKTKPKKILQKNEIDKLFAYSENWYIHAFRFILLTGLRRGEFCSLLFDRDFDGQIIHVHESISHDGIITNGKTSQANRYIPLSNNALKELNAHLAERKALGIKSDYLFCTEKGKQIPARKIRDEWQKWREANNISCTLHELRHTHISYLVKKSDEDLLTLKKIFGHSKKMDTEKVYVHEIEKNEREIFEEQKRLQKIAFKIDRAFTDEG